MTLCRGPRYIPIRELYLKAPRELKEAEISIIVPVKDDIERLRTLCGSLQYSASIRFVRELIVVDNGSASPVRFIDFIQHLPVAVRIVRFELGGPGAARNAGATEASGNWLLFVDSDCVATPELFESYASAVDGAIAYCGNVIAKSVDLLSRFYDAESTLVPYGAGRDDPNYIITANVLIWKYAFDVVGRFDERFSIAGGEDIDLGLRLRSIGRIKYVHEAIVLHDYGGPWTFFRRFYRYGRASAMLERKYAISFRSRPIWVHNTPFVYQLLVLARDWMMLIGYIAERRGQREAW
jgi:GT2 family glycosyltransferase